ncbi:MAG: ribonuclease HI [Leptolyngbya foveolarum]|uniref:Ribonuclease H n=1 Tax=Leptolyngbya foveolarum TaxID=47253 RepID=A0A2W4ULT7_9CYAN|nr:MAG: ribonuclease HI [Leptolyngbya foveolarum]
MPTVQEIYTDGACSGNPGPGGWGTRIEFSDGQVHELGGRDTATTNNRMEMQAAIAALDFLSQDEAADSAVVLLHTDSEYVKNGITKWINGWKKKGWKTSAGKPVLNKDLWQQLDQLSQTLAEKDLKVDWRYVRGHTGNPGNERCDEIARAYSHTQPISLSQYKATAKKKSAQQKKVDKNSEELLESYVESATQAKINEKEDDNRDPSISIPKINTATTEESSEEAALKSYEQAPDSNFQTMASPDSKLSENGTSRIDRLENALKTLQVTDELAKQGYLITSAELADLMDVNASAVTSRGDYWAWRNWTVSRIRREGNQILWQLERIDE